MDTEIWCCIMCGIVLIIVSINLAMTIQTKKKCANKETFSSGYRKTNINRNYLDGPRPLRRNRFQNCN